MYAIPKLRWRLPAALVGLLAFSVSLSPTVQAKAAPDRDRTDTQRTAKAGGCDDGTAEVFLDGNNVNALLFNNGSLFWSGGDHIYEVPKGSGRQAIFASGIWVGGEIGGVTHFAGSDYGPYEYWPGPLDSNGSVAPDVCAQFNRFWKVNRSDITEYNQNGTADNADLASWPIAWGAPFFVDLNGDGRRNISTDDGAGNEDGVLNEPSLELQLGDAGYGTRQLDLAAGERPDIVGDQGIWWVMNDAGNTHDWGDTPQIGIEVQAQAFSFSTADALNNTTFYKYQIFYRGATPLENAYIGLWSDPDLGFFSDDYVGSNPDEGIGFVYNGDNFDEGSAGYGAVPPALGYDFFQGPLVDADGVDNNGNGEVDEAGERIAMEKFVYYNNDGTVQGNPGSGQEAYQYLQGFWRDNTPITFGGAGYQTGEETDFMFPANPPAFWSEYNIDGLGTANTPADRRFVMSAGPFVINPGDFQEVVFGIVWSQAQGTQAAQPQIASVRQMFFDDITAQAAFNADFDIPPPPPSVVVEATALDQSIILEWDSETGNILDLFGYEVESPFASADATDNTYNFEGFQVFQYRNPSDQVGQLIATFDFQNNVTSVTDVALDTNTGEIITEVVALGEDNGGPERTSTSLTVANDAFTSEPLRNNTTYYFGVQPYAYNAFSSPQKVYAAPVTRVEARPAIVDTRNDGTILNTTTGTSLPIVREPSTIGGGVINARVTNPAAITGDSYQVQFFTQLEDLTGDGVDNDEDGEIDEDDEVFERGVNYRIVNTTTGTTILDGDQYFANTGSVLPQTSDAIRADGLAFDVQGPEDGPLFPDGANSFVEVQSPTGIDPCGPDAISTAGCAETGGNNVLNSFNSDGTYILALLGPAGTEASIGGYAPRDFEVRFTEEGSFAYWPFTSGNLIKVPFEVWDIGLTPPGSENDPSDDIQMIPNIFSDDGSECDFAYGAGENFGRPSTDRIYAYYAVGDDYDAFAAAAEAAVNADPNGCPTAPATATAGGLIDFGRGRPIQRNVITDNTGTGDISTVQNAIIRFYTTDPNQPGDVYTINTADFAASTGDQTTREDALDLIAITPNPYRGVAEYETASSENIARFVNLPAQATIRIFTLSGTLVRTLEKTNPSMTTIDWDLRTEAALPIASGIYLIHVEARDSNNTVLGERVLKFGVVQRRVQLDVL
ncbi:MAG: T9SS type A sorting domain-containing protein [Bacteroidota bacterium]